MADFSAAYPTIFSNEVGYVNDPKDKGGETMNGITRKNFPDWPGWATVDTHALKNGDKLPELDNLTQEFYKTTQWDAIKGDLISSQPVATFVADWFVNSGRHAIQALQKSVGVTADGVMGPGTIEAVNGCDEQKLLTALKAARIDFYNGIVAKDPGQGRFLDGWLARVDRLG
jgi:lysozyme family protein